MEDPSGPETLKSNLGISRSPSSKIVSVSRRTVTIRPSTWVGGQQLGTEDLKGLQREGVRPRHRSPGSMLDRDCELNTVTDADESRVESRSYAGAWATAPTGSRKESATAAAINAERAGRRPALIGNASPAP